MRKSTLYTGLDEAKESIEVAVAEPGRSGEVRAHGGIPNTPEALTKLVRKLGRPPRELSFVCEAGPCGYGTYRHSVSLGAECTVVAPSKTPRRPGDRIKNDRRDAITLARLHRAGELTAVWVPDTESEAMRDLTRAREDCKYAQTRARQRLGSVPAPSWPVPRNVIVQRSPSTCIGPSMISFCAFMYHMASEFCAGLQNRFPS